MTGAALLLALAAAQGGSDIWLADVGEVNGAAVLTNVRRVTDRPGYDNQPWFAPDGATLLYTSYRDGQADIWRYDLASGAHAQLTDTPESEYSPRLAADGGLVVVRVEADSTQRLWTFPADSGPPRVLLPAVRGVGYYDFLPDGFVVFRLGRPPTLERVTAAVHDTIARGIGSTLQAVPEAGFVMFVALGDSVNTLRVWMPELGVVEHTVPLPGGPFFAVSELGFFAPDRTGAVFWHPPMRSLDWRPLPGLAQHGVTGVTRIAVSPDGATLALVAAEGS